MMTRRLFIFVDDWVWLVGGGVGIALLDTYLFLSCTYALLFIVRYFACWLTAPLGSGHTIYP